MGRAPLVGNRDVTGGAHQMGGNFPFYALYGNVRSNLPESGARPRTRLESDCGVCVCVCSTRHLSFIFVFMVTNEMFNLLSGIRFGPIYGIFISVLLRVHVTTRSVPVTRFVLRMREIASTSCLYDETIYGNFTKKILDISLQLSGFDVIYFSDQGFDKDKAYVIQLLILMWNFSHFINDFKLYCYLFYFLSIIFCYCPLALFHYINVVHLFLFFFYI